jgi:hypothetical protein
MQSGRKDGDYCSKNKFFLYEKEAFNCVCDDYAPWKIPFKISDSPLEYDTDIEQGILKMPRVEDGGAEYLSELTVEKQIKNFDDILTATMAKGAEAWGVAPEDLTSANNENLAEHLGHIARAKENTMTLVAIFQAIQKKKEEGDHAQKTEIQNDKEAKGEDPQMA